MDLFGRASRDDSQKVRISFQIGGCQQLEPYSCDITYMPSLNTDDLLAMTVIKTHLQYLHLGDIFKFVHTDQNFL
jgi:hypothetical protein